MLLRSVVLVFLEMSETLATIPQQYSIFIVERL